MNFEVLLYMMFAIVLFRLLALRNCVFYAHFPCSGLQIEWFARIITHQDCRCN
jgi:hypothetical protein